MKILVFGASGSGTTTLGKAIAKAWNTEHLDADDYYWEKTDPPFQKKVPLEIRNQALWDDFDRYQKVIVSGSLVSWGEKWTEVFDLAVFLRLESAIRMNRLRLREEERLGDKLKWDPTTREQSEAFLDWANQYDDPAFEGRSLRLHQLWATKLKAQIIELNSHKPIRELVDQLKLHWADSGYL